MNCLTRSFILFVLFVSIAFARPGQAISSMIAFGFDSLIMFEKILDLDVFSVDKILYSLSV